MISDKMKEALLGGSAIRAMFMEGKEMAQKFGADQVYDFSLGNPATEAPKALEKEIIDILQNEDNLMLHGYMNNSGFDDVRQAMADNLNERFSTDFTKENFVMTVGAAGGLNIILKCLLNPGDEVIVFTPYFGEYKNYVKNYDGILVEVDTTRPDFQPDMKALKEAVTKRTKAVIINTPNNPTGVIYTKDTLEQLGQALVEKEKELGTSIYLISDEPYRELVYGNQKEEFLTKYYHNTIVGYSFSKSLSLPGERIGYVAVPNQVDDFSDLMSALNVANRILGFVNAPSLMQKAVARCVNEKTNIAYYDKNRKTLYEALTAMGFTCVEPQGAFYLWMKAPVDEEEFVNQGKKYHILMVKGSTFGCKGYVRLAYCVSYETIVNSLKAFEQLAKDYQ